VHSFYVYYRVQPELAGEARQAIEAMLAAIELACGVTGRLQCKRDEPTLWMEVYSTVPDAGPFERALRDAVARSAAERYLAPGSARKTECFLG